MNIILPSLAKDSFLIKGNEYDQFGGEGKNISPEIKWDDIPVETKSFAITLYDPDAPTGSGFWHWVIYNIPDNISGLPENTASNLLSLSPKIVQAKNDFGTEGYGGPCPPLGEIHRYIFTVHALNIEKIDVPMDMTNAVIRFIINQHTIVSNNIITYYKR